MESSVIPISHAWDLRVTVKEYKGFYQAHNDSGHLSIPIKTADFRVEKSTLITNSKKLRTEIAALELEESNLRDLILEDDKVVSMFILFHCLNKPPVEGSPNSSAIDVLSIEMKDIWYLVRACDKYYIDMTTGALKRWFIFWYDWQTHSLNFNSEAMFPLYKFDHAIGFQSATHALVYNRDYVTEHNPTEKYDQHLRPRILQQLNAARGRLRNVLHNNLFNKIAKLLDDGHCKCREQTFYKYFKELRRIDVWPLENTTKHSSINQLLDKLEEFNGFNVRPRGVRYCRACDKNWGQVVSEARTYVSEYFNGLCLDCMSVSKALRDGRDPHHEYWYKDVIKQYDRNCRITHGNSTWWYSFMGRREQSEVIAD